MTRKQYWFISLLLCILLLFVGCQTQPTDPTDQDSEQVTESETVGSDETEAETEESSEADAELAESESETEQLETEAQTEEMTVEADTVTEGNDSLTEALESESETEEASSEADTETEESEALTEDSETEADIEEETDEVDTKSEESESVSEDSETETDKKEESTENGTSYNAFLKLSAYNGVLVRFGSIVQGESPLEDLTVPQGYVDILSELVAVSVEILDVVEYDSTYAEQIRTMNVLYLPTNALPLVTEGEEAMVFIQQTFGYDKQNEIVQIGYMDQTASPRPLPIFRMENGCMMIDEEQSIMKNDRYVMPFLNYAYDANKLLEPYFHYHPNFFRNGMTVEELERFYCIVRDLCAHS